MQVSTAGRSVNPSQHPFQEPTDVRFHLHPGEPALSHRSVCAMSFRFSPLLAVLLSLSAVQAGVPEAAIVSSSSLHEDGALEVTATEDGTPVQVSTRRTLRVALVAARLPASPAVPALARTERDQVLSAPRFRDVRHLVPRYGE
jgi:hypothetical protein